MYVVVYAHHVIYTRETAALKHLPLTPGLNTRTFVNFNLSLPRTHTRYTSHVSRHTEQKRFANWYKRQLYTNTTNTPTTTTNTLHGTCSDTHHVLLQHV